jgi:hypothetical protein
MNNRYNYEKGKDKSVGDLCEALADGDLPAVVEDGFYIVRERDLMRFAYADALVRLTARLDSAAIDQLVIAS